MSLSDAKNVRELPNNVLLFNIQLLHQYTTAGVILLHGRVTNAPIKIKHTFSNANLFLISYFDKGLFEHTSLFPDSLNSG